MKNDPKEVALQAVLEASAIVKAGFGTSLKVMIKKGNPQDLVTDIDLASEKVILSRIKKYFPDHGIFSEEAGQEQTDSPYLWMIDPIDGTTNFIHGIPCVSISIALLHNQEVILGVVVNPITDEYYVAEKGQGAFWGKDKIHVSNTVDLKKAFVCAEWWSRNPEFKKRGLDLFSSLAKQCAKIRYLSGTVWALTRVARGLIDVETCDTSFLDIAAAALIVEEAGGMITNELGEKIQPGENKVMRIVAANPVLHQKVISLF